MGLFNKAGGQLKSVVYVTTPSQLTSPKSDVLYVVDGSVDMGSTTIDLTNTDLNISGANGAREVAKLFSTEDNHTMFTGNPAGNVYMTEMSLCTTGTNSKLFDLTNGGNASFEFQNMNFGGFGVGDGVTSMGEVNNYRQGFMSGCGFYFVNDGLTLSGAWSGFVVQDSNVINPTTAMTLLKEGTSLTFSGSVRSNINFLSVNSASVLADFQEANFLNKGAFSLNNVRTTATNAIPNIASSSDYVRFRNCDGIKDTYIGGQWSITSQATTTITSANTPVKVAGTTTYVDMQWFEAVGNNTYRYTGTQTIEVECKGVVSMTGGNNDQASIFFRHYDDSEASYNDAPKTQATLNGGVLGTRAEGVPFFGYFTVNQNDLIEVWVENNTDTTNITVVNGGLTSVTKRAS